VFAQDTLAIVKQRIKEGLKLADDVFGGVQVAIGDLYKPVTDLTVPLADDVPIAAALREADARLYLVYGAARRPAAETVAPAPARSIKIRRD
jgi:hypothetical protein